MSPASASFVLSFSRVRLVKGENLLPEGPDFGQGPGTVPRLSPDTVLWYRLVQSEDWAIWVVLPLWARTRDCEIET